MHNSNERHPWRCSANAFALISPKIPFYSITAKRLAKNSEIGKGMSIVDLGCGSSGLLIRAILKQEKMVKTIYAVDDCQEMLDVLQTNISTGEPVTLLKCSAENLDTAIEHNIDRILINCAVWQFSLPSAFAAMRKVLKPSGRILFNIAEWDVETDAPPNNMRYTIIDEVLSSQQLPPKPNKGRAKKITQYQIADILEKAGLFLYKIDFFTTPMKPQDWAWFYQIPAIVAQSLPHLPAEEAAKVFGRVTEIMAKRKISEGLRWAEVTVTLNL